MSVKRLEVSWAPYLFLGPFLAIFLIFGIFPIFFSLYLMFHIWDPVQGLGSMEYVGLENIVFALEDPLMWTSLENTLWLAVAELKRLFPIVIGSADNSAPVESASKAEPESCKEDATALVAPTLTAI